ncbi:MAG: hypothetical protein MOGMAGMI_00957 [Candidatus Omnitrophica bacterium]|nr:hypothetical protein [Candidatus Omnitrophota bacterium]
MTMIKDAVNAFCSPVIIFTASMVCFYLFVRFPRQATSMAVSLPLLGLALAGFAFGLTDDHFRKIITTPDNVPIVGMLFIFLYFTWYAVRKGVINDQRMERGESTIEQTETNEKVLVFPYLIFIEFVMALAYAIVLVVWSIFLKAPLEEPANPTISPNPSKAPWYFLGLQELLVYFDPWIAGVLLPTFIIIGLCAIPYIDRDTDGSGYFSFKKRRAVISTYLFGFWILWVLLIVIGTFMRGPNWNFFGPFEKWDIHKTVPLLNINLSEIIFIKWLGIGLPKLWIVRELPGILLTLGYFMVPPAILAKTKLKSAYQKLGPVRYAVLMMLLLVMVSVPIKMYLRWAFNLKYIVAIPEFFFNI